MMIIHNLCTAIFQALGDSKRPVVLLAVGGVLNVCFDAILIIVLPWGVVGAGIATFFSQSIAAIALFIILIQVDEAVISIGCHIMKIIFRCFNRYNWSCMCISADLASDNVRLYHICSIFKNQIIYQIMLKSSVCNKTQTLFFLFSHC